jgi:hypothetical protein
MGSVFTDPISGNTQITGSVTVDNINIRGIPLGSAGLSSNAIWLPSTTVQWNQVFAPDLPTFTLPSGGVMSYTRQKGLYRWTGNDLVYTINVAGTLTAAPTVNTGDFIVNVPYPINTGIYNTSTIIGEFWLSSVYENTSNIFKAYAKTIPDNTNSVTIRILTGTADETMATIRANTGLTLQGTMTYNTTSFNQTGGVPAAYLPAMFFQDTNGKVSVNSNLPPRGRLDIYENSNTPALIVDQYGTGDAFQVKDKGVTQFSVASTGDVYVGEYTEYASYISYSSNVLPPSADGRINGVNITALNKRTRTSGASAVAAVSSWTARASAADNAWRSVCWAPELSLFVATAISGVGNRVMTSPDGITWTSRTSAADNDWYTVTWAPELLIFVAVAVTGAGNRVMTSSNGITWTTRATPVNNQWYSIVWAPELSIFVAGALSGTGNRIMTSPDGITWTTRVSAADNQWGSVTWAPELSIFVAVAFTGTGNRVMTSPNGINWTTRASAADNGWYSVTWSPELSLFATVSSSSVVGNRVMTSPDGITWTTRASAADNGWEALTWSPELSIFVAIAYSGVGGNRVMTSPDGIIWRTRASAADNVWLSVTWASELSIFVAVAQTGTGNRVMTSAIGMPNSKSVVKALPSQMMVDANGNVGIGTGVPTEKLHVNGGKILLNSSATDTMMIKTTSGGAAAFYHIFNGGTAAFGYLLWFQCASASVGNISTNGSTTAYNTSSDYRLKENIQPMTNCLEKVALLKPCSWKWKHNGTTGHGFVAHELAEIVPDCVTGEKDGVNQDGQPIYQGVDASFLVSFLTSSIQELKSELDLLKAEIEKLKRSS